MPTYLDFNSTKSFRDFVLSKTLSKPNGPQTFTQGTYTVQGTLDTANVDLPEVDANRTEDLLQMQRNNIFKPLEFFVRDTFDVLPRRANLSLYPYFNMGNHTLISIMSTDNYDTESELFKFAARNIKENTDGPVFGRIKQNLATATTGRLRLLDALNGNIATATNIITGREPLIAPNFQITTAKTAPGQAIDFLQVAAGVEFPFSEIPGDYLTNPKNPQNIRPTASTATGAFIQDVTGALGSLVGIQRRPSLSRKPSDTFIEYMGDGQRNVLYDLLSYSTYAPNYTTTARQQQSSKIFNFVQTLGQNVKNILGMEAPRGLAYIGDDRGDDVKFAMNDLNDRPVRSNFYLSLMFDPVQARLFERRKNVSEGGELGGRLTWTSAKSNNRLGANNKEWDYQQSEFNDSLSTNHSFRSDSILGITQEILDTLPSDAGAARSHVANVIDQTSRIFREGDVLMSRGSAIKYTDQYGQESGVEYCRVWTKDNSYYNYSDTMKRTTLIRKYDDSVLSTPWNLNITPVSNGNKSFDESTNIDPIEGKAKKYMFSIENLAWKTSTTPGFTVNDLPVCERGPNGGRIMWFPPYDLKVSEQNSARWESNAFLGRPEPIYTYQNTERSGQISFKIVVDHPSVLNLLVREVFKNMSDEESENYINAFFAGCEEIDFYDLIRRYNTITPDDAKLIREFLNQGKDEVVIKNYRITTDDITEPAPNTKPNPNEPVTEQLKIELNFANDFPRRSKNEFESDASYSTLYNQTIGSTAWVNITVDELKSTLYEILSGTTTYNTANAVHDKLVLYGKNIPTGDTSTQASLEVDKLQTEINQATSNYQSYTNKLSTLKTEISEGKINEITITMLSSTSAVADNNYNYKLSIRRSHSIVTDIINQLKKDGTPTFKWDTNVNGSSTDKSEVSTEVTFKDLGYSELNGVIKFRTLNAGEEYSNEKNVKCGSQDFKYVSSNGRTLKISSPIAFGCRQTTLDIKTIKTTNKQEDQKPKTETLIPPKTKLVQSGETTVPSGAKRPQIDPLKRIITKTLSECFYFKKLEESDPVVFKSLKEKLKYFHPAFHSTTPEGLNARLTFLNQCVRPGETLPIKGLSDQSDLYARNTSFGPPPICVIRVGDFYHSKVVIRDVNITFDENVWDLNPEGIGVQPMIANVSLQVNFIGGQGLNEPVNKLQNALSSNFYANTEMYDERSVVRNASIGGSTGFTKTFLEQILKNSPLPAENNLSDKGDDLRTGDYIGVISGTTLTYKKLIDNVYGGTTNYFTSYIEMYNKLVPKFGKKGASLILSPVYRTVNDYDVFFSSAPTSGTIDIFGEYKNGLLLSDLTKKLKSGMLTRLSNTDLCLMFEFDKDLSSPKQIKANELLNPYIKSFIEKTVDSIGDTTNTKDFIDTRNNLIQSLDKVNMVVKYGKDFLIDGQDVVEFTLSGFTSNLLYDEYVDCINFITGKTNEFYVDLDTTLDLKKPDITANNLSELLSIWLKEYKNELLKVFEVDTLIFDSSTVEKLSRRLDKFFTTVESKKFKFNYPRRKNDKEVSFDIASDSVVTSDTTKKDIKNLFSNKLPITENKLNFYKP